MAQNRSEYDAELAKTMELPQAEQVEYWREWLATKPDDPFRPQATSYLAGNLADLHVERGETSMVYLREAIDMLGSCLDALPKGHNAEGTICATLLDINRTAFATTNDLVYINDAISLGYRALKHADPNEVPGSQRFRHARRAFRLAVALNARYTSGDETASRQPEDLDEAILYATYSVHQCPSTDSEKSARLDHLCMYLLAKARRTEEFEYVQRAITERKNHNREASVAQGQNGQCACGINIDLNRCDLAYLLSFRYGQTHDDADLESMIQLAAQGYSEEAFKEFRAYPEQEFNVDNVHDRAAILRVLADRANEWYSLLKDTPAGARFNRLAAISLYYAHLEHIKADTVDILRHQNEALPKLETLLEDEWEAGGREEYALEADYAQQWHTFTNGLVAHLDQTGRKEITEEIISKMSNATTCRHHLGNNYTWLDGAPQKPAHLHWTIPMLPGMQVGSYRPMEWDENGNLKLIRDEETEK